MAQIEIYRNDKPVGKVSAEKSGLYTVIEASCDVQDERVYRLAAVVRDSDGGAVYSSIGVMAPGAVGLALKKSMTKIALSEKGISDIDDVERFELILPHERPKEEKDRRFIPFKPVRNPPQDKGGKSGKQTDDNAKRQPDIQYVQPENNSGQKLTDEAPVDEPVTIDAKLPDEVKLPGFADALDLGQGSTEYAETQTPGAVDYSVPPPYSVAAEPPTEQIAPPQAEKQPEPLQNPWKKSAEVVSLLPYAVQSIIVRERCADLLVREEDGAVYIAAEVADDKPFALMPIFCLGTPETIDGAEYLVFKVENGVLTI
jgi:hypothetical protein